MPKTRLDCANVCVLWHLCVKVETRYRAEGSRVVGPGRFAPGGVAQWSGWARSVCGRREFFLLSIMHGVPGRKPISAMRAHLPRSYLFTDTLNRVEKIPRSVSSKR